MMTEPFRDPEWTSWLLKEELWGGAGGADGLVGTQKEHNLLVL